MNGTPAYCLPCADSDWRLLCSLPCSFFFNVGLAGFGGWLLVAAYLILYVKYYLNVPGEWEEYSPRAIPLATICSVCSLIAFVVALWPVWGFLTIPAIFCLFLGALNIAHFVPL